MSDKTPEQQEIETLREHNSELLADLKKARKKANELTEQVTALEGERDTAKADLQKVTLGKPVNAMLERLALLPEHFQREFNERGYTFDLDGEEVVIRDAEGNPAMLGEKTGDELTMREAKFTEADIKHLVTEEWLPEADRSPHVANFNKLIIASRASGGGASGARPGAPTAGSAATPKAEPERLATGLR